jgi:hypothetical protein
MKTTKQTNKANQQTNKQRNKHANKSATRHPHKTSPGKLPTASHQSTPLAIPPQTSQGSASSKGSVASVTRNMRPRASSSHGQSLLDHSFIFSEPSLKELHTRRAPLGSSRKLQRITSSEVHCDASHCSAVLCSAVLCSLCNCASMHGVWQECFMHTPHDAQSMQRD